MAEVILRAAFEDAGLGDSVALDSTGVSDEEFGHPIDPRAQKVLREHGYEVPRHRARQISADEAAHTDLLLPMTAAHKRALLRFVPLDHREAVHLYRSFDPALSVPASPYDDSIDLVDPWYGGPREFDVAIDQIEGVAPYIVDYVEKQL
jgi:protein-tyrosine phosphatase